MMSNSNRKETSRGCPTLRCAKSGGRTPPNPSSRTASVPHPFLLKGRGTHTGERYLNEAMWAGRADRNHSGAVPLTAIPVTTSRVSAVPLRLGICLIDCQPRQIQLHLANGVGTPGRRGCRSGLSRAAQSFSSGSFVLALTCSCRWSWPVRMGSSAIALALINTRCNETPCCTSMG